MISDLQDGVINLLIFHKMWAWRKNEGCHALLNITAKNYLPMISDLQVSVINLLIFCK